ncbi:unnamed protein product [Tenebrio molitor]|nr:unnamed protein product [Tenebrio molitor]
MSNRKYIQTENTIFEKIKNLATETMKEAGKEECHLAKEAGEIDSNGRVLITVIVVGAWSKRSYKTNYNESSGVGCIIGARTMHVLYIGVKYKYQKFKKKQFLFTNAGKIGTVHPHLWNQILYWKVLKNA